MSYKYVYMSLYMRVCMAVVVLKRFVCVCVA